MILIKAIKRISIKITVLTGALLKFHKLLYKLSILGASTHVPPEDDEKRLNNNLIYGAYKIRVASDANVYFLKMLFLISFIVKTDRPWIKRTKNPKKWE